MVFGMKFAKVSVLLFRSPGGNVWIVEAPKVWISLIVAKGSIGNVTEEENVLIRGCLTRENAPKSCAPDHTIRTYVCLNV